MTFTFVQPFDDIARVRMSIADTNNSKPIFQDELIQALIDEYNGSWQRAVIAALDNLIMQLSRNPDFKADWLEVKVSVAIDTYTAMRTTKYQEFGLARISGSVVHSYRLDLGDEPL